MRSLEWKQLVGQISHGKMSLIGDERVINLQRTKVYVFSDSVLCLGKTHENTQSNDAWEDRLGWFKSSPVYSNFDKIDGEPMDFEWHIFPGFNTLQLSDEVKSLLLKLGETPENFLYWSEGIVYCTCGHLLKETVVNRSFIVYTLDHLSIPEYVIKKGTPHGPRYGKPSKNKEYFLANNLKKRCIKRDYKRNP